MLARHGGGGDEPGDGEAPAGEPEDGPRPESVSAPGD
jgi:hypothetical protein